MEQDLYTGDLFDSDKFFGVTVLTRRFRRNYEKSNKHCSFTEESVIINARIDPDDYRWLVVRQEP